MTIKTKADERDHIERIGPTKWERAVALAMFQIKQDSRLVGLDKTREQIAFEAALRATGFPKRPLLMGTRRNPPTQEFQNICEEVCGRAVAAARR